jgi:hypothetical protein
MLKKPTNGINVSAALAQRPPVAASSACIFLALPAGCLAANPFFTGTIVVAKATEQTDVASRNKAIARALLKQTDL